MKQFKLMTDDRPSKYLTLLELAKYVRNEVVFDEISEMPVGKAIGFTSYMAVERVK